MAKTRKYCQITEDNTWWCISVNISGPIDLLVFAYNYMYMTGFVYLVSTSKAMWFKIFILRKLLIKWKWEPDPSALLRCRTVMTFHVVKNEQVMSATEVIRYKVTDIW